jgi:4-amino-4-deoxy-L-arabinose transferase-like glycosyltransferase
VNANIYYLSETLSAFLICMFICIFYLACIYKKNNLWFFIGLILGAAALVRPFILYFVFVLVLLVVITPLVVEKLKVVLILLLGFFFLVAPWSLRNHHHFGYLADDTLIINTLIHGMYPDFMFQENPESYGFPYRHDPHAEEVSKSVDTALGEIKKRFSEDPVKHLHWYIIGKPLGLWSWNIVQGQGDAFIYPVKQSPYYEKSLFQFTHTLSKYSHVLCVIFAALASLLVWVQKLSAVMVSNKSALYTLKMTSLLLIYTTVLHMVGAPFPRYSIPLRPELYLMACFFVYLLISFIWSKKSKNS